MTNDSILFYIDDYDRLTIYNQGFDINDITTITEVDESVLFNCLCQCGYYKGILVLTLGYHSNIVEYVLIDSNKNTYTITSSDYKSISGDSKYIPYYAFKNIDTILDESVEYYIDKESTEYFYKFEKLNKYFSSNKAYNVLPKKIDNYEYKQIKYKDVFGLINYEINLCYYIKDSKILIGYSRLDEFNDNTPFNIYDLKTHEIIDQAKLHYYNNKSGYRATNNNFLNTDTNFTGKGSTIFIGKASFDTIDRIIFKIGIHFKGYKFIYLNDILNASENDEITLFDITNDNNFPITFNGIDNYTNGIILRNRLYAMFAYPIEYKN